MQAGDAVVGQLEFAVAGDGVRVSLPEFFAATCRQSGGTSLNASPADQDATHKSQPKPTSFLHSLLLASVTFDILSRQPQDSIPRERFKPLSERLLKSILLLCRSPRIR